MSQPWKSSNWAKKADPALGSHGGVYGWHECLVILVVQLAVQLESYDARKTRLNCLDHDFAFSKKELPKTIIDSEMGWEMPHTVAIAWAEAKSRIQPPDREVQHAGGRCTAANDFGQNEMVCAMAEQGHDLDERRAGADGSRRRATKGRVETQLNGEEGERQLP